MGDTLKGIAQGAAGGFLAGGTVLGIYLLASAKAEGADGGDWLAFAGVFFGVIATILGTQAVDRIREGRRHRAALKMMRGALDVWTATVNSFPDNQNVATLADLRQQVNYISMLSPDISRDAVAATMALHMFGFHVPAMIEKLLAVISNLEPGPPQEAAMALILNDMRGYAQNVRTALPAK